MTRKAFRKKFYSSGIYSFLSINNETNIKQTLNMRDKHAKMFGTVGEKRTCPTGVIKFNY